MIYSFIMNFIEAWVVGLIALLLGRYIRPKNKRMPVAIGSKLLLYLKVWAVTFFSRLVFGQFGNWLAITGDLQSTFVEFLLPVFAGAYYAHGVFLRTTEA
jgi:hypothetical protein